MPSRIPALSRHWPGLLLVAAAFVVALCTHGHYGVSWDDPFQRSLGEATYRYVGSGDAALFNHGDREYGTGFELPLYAAERALGLGDLHHAYRLRHVLTHALFLAACFAGYGLALRLFKRQGLALMALVLLLLHPRIYAHSFFNTKDAPAVSAVIFCLALSYGVFTKGGWVRALLFGAVCGWAASIRLPTLIVPACAWALLLARILVTSGFERRRLLQALLAVPAGAALGLYLCWPVLWQHPVRFLAEAWRSMSRYNWGGVLLFRGEMVRGDALPALYAPVWAGISTPAMWLAAGLAGAGLVAARSARRLQDALKDPASCAHLLHLGCAVAPFAAVILLRSVLYDDWRHLYFAWPPFTLLAVRAVQWVGERRRPVLRCVVWGALAAQTAAVLLFMVRAHPHQQVYFNVLAPHGPEAFRHRYELDYWGVAYKQGMEYLLADDTACTIRIFWDLPPLESNLAALPAAARGRVVLDDVLATADYRFTNFRNHPDDFPLPHVAYQIRVCNNTILRVYRLRP